jgi:hypothetical protein
VNPISILTYSRAGAIYLEFHLDFPAMLSEAFLPDRRSLF